MARTQENRVEVLENRQRFLTTSGITADRLVRIRTSHSSNIDVLTVADGRRKYERWMRKPVIETDFDFYKDGSDGIITNDRETAVGLVSADCGPLVLWQPEGLWHGILHVGLLGGLNGIILTLGECIQVLQLDPASFRFYLGPTIGPNDYDLSESGLWNAISPQISLHSPLSEIVSRYVSGTRFDLRTLISEQLQEIGAPSENIEIYEPSTAREDSPFYSNFSAKQGLKETGSFFSVISRIG
jgi:copper oxidase (laccase) domain-containing protein